MEEATGVTAGTAEVMEDMDMADMGTTITTDIITITITDIIMDITSKNSS